MTPYTVFTGDLINSSQAEPGLVDATLTNIASTSSWLATDLGQNDPRFTRFRGDGWQIALHGRKTWYRALILILARLRATPEMLATRISIATGTIETLGTRDLNDASGYAFQASGRGLDMSQKFASHRIWISDLQEPLADGRKMEWATWQDRALVAFIARTAENWSGPQAEAIKLILENRNRTQEEWARMLGITRQAFVQRYRSAAASEMEMAILAGQNQREPHYV